MQDKTDENRMVKIMNKKPIIIDCDPGHDDAMAILWALACEELEIKAITTVAFTGADGGRMRELTKLLINVPSTDTPRIQEAHITIGHIICELVEAEIFGKE